jgi:hypothetical protein
MRFYLLFFSLLSLQLQGQDGLYLDISGGFSNYQGDLQEKRFTTEQAKAAVGLGLRYHFTNKLSARSHFTYASITASDGFNKKEVLRNRNLNFKSSIVELSIMLDYTLLNLENNRISPYVAGGVAVFHFNPYTTDAAGLKYYLKPLSTEGQGLSAYPNRKKYQLTQLSIPFGGGVRWRLADDMMLSYEIALRKTSTDYLDDVSTTYVDQATLLQERGPKAVELAYRGKDKDNQLLYPAENTIRGGAKFKDWYYISQLTLSIKLNSSGKGSKGFGGNRGSVGCPKRVL